MNELKKFLSEYGTPNVTEKPEEVHIHVSGFKMCARDTVTILNKVTDILPTATIKGFASSQGKFELKVAL